MMMKRTPAEEMLMMMKRTPADQRFLFLFFLITPLTETAIKTRAPEDGRATLRLYKSVSEIASLGSILRPRRRSAASEPPAEVAGPMDVLTHGA